MDFLKNIPNLYQNLFFGALGAFMIVIYKIYTSIPDIEAFLAQRSTSKSSSEKKRGVIIGITIKTILSLIGGALVSGFLVRPQEFYGALITGMTWSAIVKKHKGKE